MVEKNRSASSEAQNSDREISRQDLYDMLDVVEHDAQAASEIDQNEVESAYTALHEDLSAEPRGATYGNDNNDYIPRHSAGYIPRHSAEFRDKLNSQPAPTPSVDHVAEASAASPDELSRTDYYDMLDEVIASADESAKIDEEELFGTASEPKLEAGPKDDVENILGSHEKTDEDDDDYQPTYEELMAAHAATAADNGDDIDKVGAEKALAEVENGHELMDSLRSAKLQAYVDKINAPTFGARRKEAMAKYKEVEANYLNAWQESLEARLAGMDLLPEERAKIVSDEVNQMRFADQQDQHQLLLQNGGRKARLLAKYAELSRWKKIGVGVAAGGVLAAGGAAVGFLAGMAGVTVGAAAAATGAGRFVRGYSTRLSELYRRRDTPKYEVHSDYYDNPVGAARSFVENESTEQIKSGERTRRRAVYGAIGAVALGGSLMALHEGVEHGWVRGGFGKVGEWANDASRSIDGQTPNPNYSTAPGQPAESLPEITESTPDSPAPGDTHSGSGTNPYDSDSSSESLTDRFMVEKGHGLIREWDEWASAQGHPISASTAAKLHAAVLKEFGPDGIISTDTYTYHGDVRISAPGRANWTPRAAKFAKSWLENRGNW